MTDPEIRLGYTRVSEIISTYSGYDKIPQFILEQACARGTEVHTLIEARIDGIGYPDLSDRARGYIESFELWYEKWSMYDMSMPDRWYDDENMLTGKCDCIMHVDGKNVLIDFKTSAKFNKTWILQGGAYKMLAEKSGTQIDSIEFLKLDSTGRDPVVYQFGVHDSVSKYPPNEAEELFKKAMQIHRCMK